MVFLTFFKLVFFSPEDKKWRKGPITHGIGNAALQQKAFHTACTIVSKTFIYGGQRPEVISLNKKYEFKKGCCGDMIVFYRLGLFQV